MSEVYETMPEGWIEDKDKEADKLEGIFNMIMSGQAAFYDSPEQTQDA